MEIEDRWKLYELYENVCSTKSALMRLDRYLGQGRHGLGDTFPELLDSMGRLSVTTEEIELLLSKALNEEFVAAESGELNEDALMRLRNLNRAMNTISGFMHDTAEMIRPEMQAKVADNTDPMFDYEILANIDYELREDDPEYNENTDNYLSTRRETLTHRSESKKNIGDWRGPFTPEPLQDDHLSWLLHSLTEHNSGPEGPMVDLRDCLRIGKVFLDIQVWRQYVFDVVEGKWMKSYHVSDDAPVYVQPR